MVEAELVGGRMDGDMILVTEHLPERLRFDALGRPMIPWAWGDTCPDDGAEYRRSQPVRRTARGRVAYDWITPWRRRQVA